MADQDGTRASSTLRLQRGPFGKPDTTRLVPLNNGHDVEPGYELKFLLLDFAPGARVELAVYRHTGRQVDSARGTGFDFEFVRELPAVKVNQEGWKYHSIAVPDGLPPPATELTPGFCVVADPELKVPYCTPGPETTFTLRR